MMNHFKKFSPEKVKSYGKTTRNIQDEKLRYGEARVYKKKKTDWGER